MKYYILFGPPGAGKGTQAEVVSDRLGIPTVSTGAIIREAIKLETEMGLKAKKFIEKGEAELSYIESVFDLLSRARTDDEVIAIREELVAQGYLKNHRKNNQKPVKLAPKEYISTDGFKILCGRNNIQNDKLTFKDSRKSDIWLHTQKIHGSHTVIVTEGREVPETTIQQAAVVAAYNSKGRESSLVPVDYTEIRNVKKPSGAAPGKAIYEHYKTAYVRPAQFENLFENK